MRRVEATGVTSHCNQAGLLLKFNDLLHASQVVGHRNLNLNILASLERLKRLTQVHLCRCGKNNCIQVWLAKQLGIVGEGSLGTIFGCYFLSQFHFAVANIKNVCVFNERKGVKVLDAERT